jgi:hypothetical protein
MREKVSQIGNSGCERLGVKFPGPTRPGTWAIFELSSIRQSSSRILTPVPGSSLNRVESKQGLDDSKDASCSVRLTALPADVKGGTNRMAGNLLQFQFMSERRADNREIPPSEADNSLCALRNWTAITLTLRSAATKRRGAAGSGARPDCDGEEGVYCERARRQSSRVSRWAF